jgi:hypothetical protein
LKVKVAGTAGGTVNVGIGGAANAMFSGTSNVTVTDNCVAHNATWGTDNYGAYPFAATDTIDIVFVADETKGEMELYIPGYYLD